MAKKTEKPIDEKIAAGEPAQKKRAPKPRKTKELLETAKDKAAKKTAKTKPSPKPKTKAKPKPRKTAEAKKDNPHVTRPTAEEEAKQWVRRNLVYELKKSGASFRQISEHLKAKNIEGSSVGQVHADWSFMLNMQAEDLALSVEQHREAEIAILDEVQFSFYPDIKKDNPNPTYGMSRKDAAEVVLACIKERARLRNLYKPTKINLSADEELAKLLGIAAEQLPENSDNEHSTDG